MLQLNTRHKYLKYKHKYLNLKHESNNGVIQMGGADKMVLVHATSSLLDILDSGYIFPASITKTQNYDYIDDDYLEYIFMNTIPNDNELFAALGMGYAQYIIFPSNILRNRIFYTDIHQARGDLDAAVKYPKGYTKIDSVLSKLYKYSRAMSAYSDNLFYGEFWNQEIFFSKKVSLKYASHIIISADVLTDIIGLIKNKYPNIKIIIKPPKTAPI